MRPSLRFLGLVMVGWVGARSAMLGAIPGGELFTLGTERTAPPPIIATEFPPIEPVASEGDSPGPIAAWFAAAAGPQQQPAYDGRSPRSAPASPPVGRDGGWWPWPARSPPTPSIVPASAPQFLSPIPGIDDWPQPRFAVASFSTPLGASSGGARQSVPILADANRLDRVQLTAWALLRGTQGAVSAPDGLANGSTLGASQAGARIAYNFTRQVAATLRTTSTVGRRGGEVALGARVQPLGGIPLWVTAERRMALGRYGGGRNAFALFFEGGLWNRPLPMDFRLDAYAQGGVVGFRKRDAFVDGAVTATRPVYRNFSAGIGLWGGAQPGVYRVDAGPRVTMRVRDSIAVHLDYRQRLAGNAEPGSGPALTLAADF